MLYFIHNKYRSSIQIFWFHLDKDKTDQPDCGSIWSNNQGSTVQSQKPTTNNQMELQNRLKLL